MTGPPHPTEGAGRPLPQAQHRRIESEDVAIGPPWTYLLDFLTGQVRPWDRGVLDAHLINAGPTSQIERHQRLAARRRRGILARLSPWRRRYLDGLAWGLERELERRTRERA